MGLKEVLAAYGLIITQSFSAPPLAHKWLLLNNKHWMIDSGTAIPEPSHNVCGDNMVKVDGEMKVDGNSWKNSVDELQKKACLKWIERKEPLDKCAVYDRNKWLSISSTLKTKHMNFCIDKFEAPNVAGQDPIIMVSLDEAQQLCSNAGKRICNEDEITFACEGEEALPYGCQ